MIRLAASLLAFLLLLAAPQAGAQVEREIEIKAAFLYKFGDFVEWPEGAFAPGRPFTIGVMGAPDMAEELERVTAGRTVQGRPVRVRRVTRDAVLDGLHVLFVGRAEAPHLAAILGGAQGLAVLTVTDMESALSKGSMINFIAAESRVRFDIALAPAERSHLRISARLLSVARRVVTS